MIYISRNIGFLNLDLPGKSLCVAHKSYQVPNISDCRHMDFDRFQDDPQAHMKGFDNLVIVGLNRLITPSNRIKHVWEVVYNRLDARKVSVDTTLFVGEPWRLWFHFGLVGAKYLDYTYSYIGETRWRQWVDGMNEHNPFAVEEVLKWSKGLVICDYDRYFDEPRVETIPVTDEQRDGYESLKAELFESESTIKGVIAKLGRYAQTICPQRKIPTTSRLFDREHHEIVKTDLRVDDYLTSEILNLISYTNALTEGMHHVN